MNRQIAIIGSSGGNLFNLGGKDPRRLLNEILIQMESTGLSCTALQFIAADASMDTAKPSTRAVLYTWSVSKGEPVISAEGTLQEMNAAAGRLDRVIAEQIELGEIDGIIAMSPDPEGCNRHAFEAAAVHKLPVVGTGGTSMALLKSRGVQVISASGTTGTTNRTRAVAFVTSLCKHWRISYRPVIGGGYSSLPDGAKGSLSPWKRVNLRGIMMASLPGFIGMALILALSKIPGLSSLGPVFDLMVKALPVILAVIAAKQISELDEVSIVAGIIAGVLSVEGGIIGGMIGGIGAGIIVHYVFRKCIEWRFPATTVNIVAGGVSGLIAGLFVYFLLAPVALAAGEGVRTLIESLVSWSPAIAGLIAGLLIWPAIIGGVYHAAILPIVLLEMELTSNSFLGAVDMVGLVMVSAGITLANIIAPRDKGEAAVAAPGFAINMGFGTFVEAAYPFMFSNRLVFGGAILSAGVGGLLVGMFGVRGTAYVPSFLGPVTSNNTAGFLISMTASLLMSFLITFFINKLSLYQEAKQTAGM